MNPTATKDARQEAWRQSFLDENHLNYRTSPDLIASPAQMRFMVYLEPEQPFYPCSQRVYEEIMARVKSPILGEMYSEGWGRIAHLVRSKIEDQGRADFLLDLLNIKYQHETANYNVIPSRVEKRLFKLFLDTTQIEDPLRDEKAARNRRAAEITTGPDFLEAVNRVVPPGPGCPPAEAGLEASRRWIDAAKLKRLFQASVQPDIGTRDPAASPSDWDEVFGRPVAGDGWAVLENFLLTPENRLMGHWVPRRILYLSDRAGEIVFDLAVINFLVRLGHTVILAVKHAAFYDLVHFGDVVNDPTLKFLTGQAELITHRRLTKNQLAALLRNDQRFKIISDGTMEKLNLAMTSVTFARCFKEVDGIIAKGAEQRMRLFETMFEYTQDVYSLAPEKDGSLGVLFRSRSAKVVRFSTSDLEARAAEIIARMRQSREQGMTVMFYSGIVGSIPGETDTAIQVMTVFVEDLKKQQAGTFIINPSSYFSPGMDADDLMYMWEIVQRSGLIDIWRFQTYQDIEKSFTLLGRKAPPQWVGKDATFSTGCTKEMAIATDVQKKYPEMQIIGPDPERFMRRGEYGIGLLHDARLSEIYSH
ncbi:MAG: ARMT1-like domain-containing protein [Thermodesulfobacteriota bacterium]